MACAAVEGGSQAVFLRRRRTWQSVYPSSEMEVNHRCSRCQLDARKSYASAVCHASANLAAARGEAQQDVLEKE